MCRTRRAHHHHRPRLNHRTFCAYAASRFDRSAAPPIELRTKAKSCVRCCCVVVVIVSPPSPGPAGLPADVLQSSLRHRARTVQRNSFSREVMPRRHAAAAVACRGHPRTGQANRGARTHYKGDARLELDTRLRQTLQASRVTCTSRGASREVRFGGRFPSS